MIYLKMTALGILLSNLCTWQAASAQPTEPPTEWIEPQTGHRVVRLSKEAGSASLYFHQNAYSADGKKLLITTPRGLSTIDLDSREIEPVVDGRVEVLVTGRKTGDIYYIIDCQT
jgi:oligogalacturonide lyase